jgi:large subunit ribosomal protein L4
MAITVDVAALSGTSVGAIELDEALFGIQPNVPVLHQVVTAQLAAARRGTQSTKTRAEVSGGGKKPFKQKGTGRARQGSERAPQFTGGGVALGPKPRSYRQRTPRKMIALALRSALSDRAAEDKVKVVEAWDWDVPSTRSARNALGALGLTGRILVVLTREDEEAYKSFRNLPEVQLLLVGELNAYDILVNDWLVFTRASLPGATVEAEFTPAPVKVEPTPAPAPVVTETVDETPPESVGLSPDDDTLSADDATLSPDDDTTDGEEAGDE